MKLIVRRIIAAIVVALGFVAWFCIWLFVPQDGKHGLDAIGCWLLGTVLVGTGVITWLIADMSPSAP